MAGEVPPFIPGVSAPGATGGVGSTFTPSPYGNSYGGAGLVYGLGDNYVAAARGATPRFGYGDRIVGKTPYFIPAQSGATELGRASAWITGTLASDAERAKYQGYVGKFFPNGADFQSYQGLWAAAAEYASQVNRDDPNARWSVWDALDNMWKRFEENGGAGGAGGGGGVSTQTSTSITLTSAEDAGPTLDQALTTLLGRTATAAERSKFLAVLNAKERANPSRGTSTTRSDGSGNSTTTSSSVNTGVNPSAVAADWATEQEGFAEYQMATTYLDAMLDALSSPVS